MLPIHFVRRQAFAQMGHLGINPRRERIAQRKMHRAEEGLYRAVGAERDGWLSAEAAKNCGVLMFSLHRPVPHSAARHSQRSTAGATAYAEGRSLRAVCARRSKTPRLAGKRIRSPSWGSCPGSRLRRHSPSLRAGGCDIAPRHGGVSILQRQSSLPTTTSIRIEISK